MLKYRIVTKDRSGPLLDAPLLDAHRAVRMVRRVAKDYGIDPKRVGIMGGSFGGYSTLAGLAFAPETFACGVDVVGPSDLATLFRTFPPYWGPRKQRWINWMGDVEKDDALNRRLSPLYHADQMRAPLLIAHGANDPREMLYPFSVYPREKTARSEN